MVRQVGIDQTEKGIRRGRVHRQMFRKAPTFLTTPPYSAKVPDDALEPEFTMLGGFMWTIPVEEMELQSDPLSGSIVQVIFPVPPVDYTFIGEAGDTEDYESMELESDVVVGSIQQVIFPVPPVNYDYNPEQNTLYEQMDLVSDITGGVITQVYFPIEYTYREDNTGDYESMDLVSDIVSGVIQPG